MLSNHLYTHASPTLFNAGTITSQLASCFIVTGSFKDDYSLSETFNECNVISNYCGGIGVSIHDIPSFKYSNRGIAKYLRIFNSLVNYVDKRDKRRSSIAFYLEPWHSDIVEFLECKLETGIEQNKARELFYALWIPDLFMERLELDNYCKRILNKFAVDYNHNNLINTLKSDGMWDKIWAKRISINNLDKIENRIKEFNGLNLQQLASRFESLLGEFEKANNFNNVRKLISIFRDLIKTNVTWSLFCPKKTPGLSDIFGEDFNKKYSEYEANILFERQMDIYEVFNKIIKSQIETGTPYICFKDHVNRKNKQMNLGTIKSSNLCAEIVEYSSDDEIAVCNLASISLPNFVKNSKFDFKLLGEVVKDVTYNLNKIIDCNLYPLEKAKNSNMKHRPIAIDVQGFAKTLLLLDYAFEDEETKILNKQIFETIYFYSLQASNELAKVYGYYKSYNGSPISKGQFQFDLWNIRDTSSFMYDWQNLRDNIRLYGLRNSLVTAVMPTASTAQILGNSESTEPYANNIYSRKVLSGNYILVNKYLINELKSLNMWNIKIKNEIIESYGSVQNINLPDKIKRKYKTIWEIPQKTLVDLAADRGIFIDQSQSLNIYFNKPTFNKMMIMILYTWRKGLKTGMYYLKTKPASNPIQFSLNKTNFKSCEVCS